MPLVEQRTKTDCGIACLAMLCDVTYEEAERVIPWRKHGCLYGTDTKQLREGAKRLGYEGLGTATQQLRRLPEKNWLLIPDRSLVKVAHPDPKIRQWHWVVWRKRKIYDPGRKGVFKPQRYGQKPQAYMQFQPRMVQSVDALRENADD